MSLVVDLIKRFEGYAKRLRSGHCTTYLCSAGVLTIGYGATGRGVTPGVIWSREKAEARFDSDLNTFAVGVYQLSPTLMFESDGRAAAITSFSYNCGIKAYRNSTLRRVVNRQDWTEAQRQLMKWTRAKGKVVPGLVNRRRAESALIDL